MKKVQSFWNQCIAPACVLAVFVIFTLGTFNVYLDRTLKGDLNNHILAGDMFGTPQALKDRGVKPLYYGDGQTGWDGQFYYYMSNDLLATKDTAKHIDSPSYRYQRIGLSLYAAIVAKLTFKDWVSPAVFFWSHFLLIAAATGIGAWLFKRLGIAPALILFWSLSVGTQITLFNALPDAAADAFLIIALALLHAERKWAAAILFAFSSLSREVYAIFPTIIYGFYVFNGLFREHELASAPRRSLWQVIFSQQRSALCLLLPAIAAIAWRTYVVQHFGVSPTDQATGILGPPFSAWLSYLRSTAGTTPKETVSLMFFLLVICTNVVVGAMLLKRCWKDASPLLAGVTLSALGLAALYLCFGPTVMAHYTGYLKALSVFFFIIPLLAGGAKLGRAAHRVIYLLFLAGFLFTTLYNLKSRLFVSAGLDEFTAVSKITETRRLECFGEYLAKTEVTGVTVVKRGFLARDLLLFNVRLENTGKHDLVSTRTGLGSVYISYHWLDQQGRVVRDGIRTAILQPLKPGEVMQTTVISPVPHGADKLSLKVSPVQEGCGWFYQPHR